MKKTFILLATLMVVIASAAQTVCSSAISLKYCFTTYSENDTTIGCGLPYQWNGQSLNTTGQYQAILKNARGCDSIATLNLTIEHWSNGTDLEPVEICIPKSYVWLDPTGQKGDTTIYTTGDYSRIFVNANGCDSTVTLSVTAKSCLPQGAIDGLFSVSSEKQVYFSQGNLQYRASNGTSYSSGCSSCLKHEVKGGGYAQGQWRFALHQYDYVGNGSGLVKEGGADSYVSDTYKGCNYTGWLDVFSYGTSGCTLDADPCCSPGEYALYQDIAGSNNDWGVYNAISNGGNKPDMWRTLTKDEWDYLFKQRANASALYRMDVDIRSTIAGDVYGIVLLPDGSNATIPYQFASPSDFETWASTNHAVFLPKAGYRKSYNTMNDIGGTGLYWSSSFCCSDDAYVLYWDSKLYIPYTWDAYQGYYVRLVADAN